MKKIYIDGLGLVEGHFSGVGQYILGILRGFDELLESYNQIEFKKKLPEIIIIIPRDKVEKFNSFGFKNLRYRKFPLPFRYMAALWHRGMMPPLDLFCGRGTYLFPRFVSMPLLFSKHGALVVYDLSYELHKEFSDEGNSIFLSKGVRKSIKKANKVVAISQNAKKEIIDFYGIDPNKILVATPAADQKYFYKRSAQEIDLVKNKYGVEGEYILALSNLEPRKNLEALVESYCKLPNSLTKNLSLLLVGVNGWKTDQLFNYIFDKVKHGHKIIRPTTYVLDKDKPAIISGAKLLVYPSHYEGFGMPPLEALACGVPVITADNSSIPEVVGKYADMVPSTDRNKLLMTIVNSLEIIDEKTNHAVVDGPKQAEKFSWIKSSESILNALLEDN